jgi:hypothetical protein
MQQPLVFTRLLAVCVLAALSSTPGQAKSGQDDCRYDDSRPQSQGCHEETDEHHHGQPDDDGHPSLSANPNKLKVRLPTLVPRSSVKLELKSRAARRTFEAVVKVPVQPGTGLYLDDLTAAEDASVTLDLYRAGAPLPYASCNLDLAAIKYRSTLKRAEYAVKLGQRRALPPRASQGACVDKAVTPAPLSVPGLASGDEATVVVTVGALPPVLLVSRSPIR